MILVRRAEGIILETGLSYCEECADKPECEAHWKVWWDEQWKSQQERCEENWQKYGIYGNCGGSFGLPSMHFGYAKTEEGLKPYLSVYPDCPRYKLEKDVSRIKHYYEKIGSEECRRRIAKIVEEAEVTQDLKDRVIADVNDSLDRMDAWRKEQKPCMYCDNMAFTYNCKKVWFDKPDKDGKIFGAVCDACDKTRPLDDGRK